eukprot:scaffold52385_cov34-Tisochrysis_lutea.AAC.3
MLSFKPCWITRLRVATTDPLLLSAFRAHPVLAVRHQPIALVDLWRAACLVCSGAVFQRYITRCTRLARLALARKIRDTLMRAGGGALLHAP